MNYKDLSSYDFSGENIYANGFNIGFIHYWENEQYKRGETSTAFQNKLAAACMKPYVRYRHVEPCPFCPSARVFELIKGEKKYFGNAEIRIKYNGSIYRSPDLVFHFVKSHKYQPPQEYVNAVLLGESLERS